MSRARSSYLAVDVRCGNLPVGAERVHERAYTARDVRVDGAKVGVVYGIRMTPHGMTTAYVFKPSGAGFGIFTDTLAAMRRELAAVGAMTNSEV